MKDIILVLALSITVACAGMLKSETSNQLPKNSVNTQKFLSYIP